MNVNVDDDDYRQIRSDMVKTKNKNKKEFLVEVTHTHSRRKEIRFFSGIFQTKLTSVFFLEIDKKVINPVKCE